MADPTPESCILLPGQAYWLWGPNSPFQSPGHSEILQYLSLHSASTLAVLSNLIVREPGLLAPASLVAQR